MRKNTVLKTGAKLIIGSIIKQIWPMIFGTIVSFLTILLHLLMDFSKCQFFVKYSLLLLTVSIGLTTLFLTNCIILYRKYVKSHWAYGVRWDKELKMRCVKCNKRLKYSTWGASIVFCLDKKCDTKHVLRDGDGNEITENQARELVKKGIIEKRC